MGQALVDAVVEPYRYLIYEIAGLILDVGAIIAATNTAEEYSGWHQQDWPFGRMSEFQ